LIDWPAIIHVDGDDELVLVGSAQEWSSHDGWSAVEYSADDFLFDSGGQVYRLDCSSNGFAQPEATGRVVSISEFIALVKRHAALSSACCIEKIAFRNIEEGMAIVASLTME
jgi:hypothetical protein